MKNKVFTEEFIRRTKIGVKERAAVSGKISCLIMSVILICSILPIRAFASYEIPGVCQVQTDTGVTGAVKTLDYSYGYNTYLSLRDIAMLLKDTDKSFALEITSNAVSMDMENF